MDKRGYVHVVVVVVSSGGGVVVVVGGRLHVGALAGFLGRERLLRRERRRLPPPALATEGAAEGRAAVDAKVLARRRRLALTDVARGRRLFDGGHLERYPLDDVRVQGRVLPLEPLNP